METGHSTDQKKMKGAPMTDLQRLHEAAVLAPQLLTRIRMRLAVGEHLQPDEQLDKMQECIEVFTRAYADGPLIEVKKVQAPVEAAAPWQRKWNSQVADSLLEKFASFSPADAVVLNAMVRDLARKCDEWSSAHLANENDALTTYRKEHGL